MRLGSLIKWVKLASNRQLVGGANTTSVYPCRSRVSLAKEDLVSETMHAHMQLVAIPHLSPVA